jgi:RND superfamily putative drug exporter
MLGFIGPKVMSRKQKRNLAEHGPRIVGSDNKGFWPNWADRVQRMPWLSAGAALAVVVVLALPFFSLRLGSADQGTDPAGSPTRVGFDMLSKGFGPGFTGPLMMVGVVQPGQTAAVDDVVSAVEQQPGVAHVSQPLYIPSRNGEGQVVLVNVYPTTAPQDAATTDLVNHLRDDTIPRAQGNSGLRLLVTGTTAIYIDFANVLAAKLPLFIGLVVLLSFVLLMVVFRSFVIPATAACMNLLSIGAAFGILVAVFQWGDGGSIIGINGTSPIEAFLPVMLFAILFGLSMDYQVFLVSRMHEEYLKSGGSNRVAVRNGLAATGKTITAAALIMILVFGSFILGGQRVIKEFGIGLAAGILVDAVVIRMCIVPSVMMLFGDANWWFPRWLDRALPKLSVDADDLATHEPDEESRTQRELAESVHP